MHTTRFLLDRRLPRLAIAVWLAVMLAALEDLAAAVLPDAPPDMRDDATCLAIAMYWEAKGEGDDSMRAVGAVVLNRVEHPRYPDSICAVVTQGGETPPCQFSFWCDGAPDQPVELEPWQRARELTAEALARRMPDPTKGALFFHHDTVAPAWTAQKEETVRIGSHIFYR